MFRVTRYSMISKTESGWIGYRKKYRVAGRVWVPAGHCLQCYEVAKIKSLTDLLTDWQGHLLSCPGQLKRKDDISYDLRQDCRGRNSALSLINKKFSCKCSRSKSIFPKIVSPISKWQAMPPKVDSLQYPINVLQLLLGVTLREVCK